MNKKISKKVKRRMKIALATFVFLCTFIGYSLFKDWIQIVNNKKQFSQLTTYYNDLLTKEESLSSEVVKLQDEDYLARYAREKYMYSLPNEFIIKIIDGNFK